MENPADAPSQAPALPSPTPEILKPRPSLHFIFGAHGPDDIASLSHDEARLESILTSKPEGKVYYFVENAQYTQKLTDDITRLVNEGHTTHEAVTMALYFEQVGRYPKPAELPAALRETRKTNGVFLNTSYDMLDRLARRYPGRVGVLIEGIRSARTIPHGGTIDKLMDRNAETAYTLLQEGKFSRATDFYRQYIESMAKKVSERDRDIIIQLRERMGEEGVSDVVVRIGAVHTGIMHVLDREGYPVDQEFIGKDDHDPYVYFPYAIPMRKKRFFPTKPLSKLELTQALIGDEVFHSIEPSGQYPDETRKHKVRLTITKALLDRLQSDDQVFKFESQVKQLGFRRAVEMLLLPNL